MPVTVSLVSESKLSPVQKKQGGRKSRWDGMEALLVKLEEGLAKDAKLRLRIPFVEDMKPERMLVSLREWVKKQETYGERAFVELREDCLTIGLNAKEEPKPEGDGKSDEKPEG